MNGYLRNIATLAFAIVFSCAAKAGVLLPDVSVGPLMGAYNSHDSSTLGITSMGGQSRTLEANTLFLQGAAAMLKTGVTSTQDIRYGTGGTFPAAMPGVFELFAGIDEDNGMVSTVNDPLLGGFGEFTVSGTLDGSASPHNVELLQGTLTDLNLVAFSGTSPEIEFSGVITKDGTGEFGVGTDFVIRFHATTTFNSFANTIPAMMLGNSADVGRPVPEPQAFALWAALCAVVGFPRRRSLRKPA